METHRFINKLLVILVGTLFVLPLFSLAYDDATTHQSLTEEIIKFFNASYPDKIVSEDWKEEDWEHIIRGSQEEDSGIRWMQHYYDPVYNRGLVLGNQESNPNLAMISAAGSVSPSAKAWAESSALQKGGFSQLFGGIFTSHFNNESDYSWERGIYEYAWGDKKRGLESLGHVIHLIEDSSVPDHTRNDPHPAIGSHFPSPLTKIATWLFDSHSQTLNGSPYEGFAVFPRGSLNLANELQGEKPKQLSTLTEYFDQLASYSNNHFFSGDTIFSKDYPQPKVLRDDTEVLSDGKRYKFHIVSDGNNQEYKLVSFDEDPLISSRKFYSISDPNRLILSDYWRLLSRQAVLHGAGVVRLFFDSVEKEKETKVLYNKNRSWLTRQVDRFKSGVFGTASVLYGSSVTEADVEDVPVENTPPPPIVIATIAPPPAPVIFPLPPPSIIPPLAVVSALPPPPVIAIAPPPVQAVAPLAPPPPVVRISSFPSGAGGEQTPPPPPPPPAVSEAVVSPPPPPSEVVVAPPPPPADTTPPDFSFSITECNSSLSPDICLIATTSVSILWSSDADDLSHFEITCTQEGSPCVNFNFASTTATSTMYVVPQDNTTYTFTARAYDTTGNASTLLTQAVSIITRPLIINEVAWAGTSASKSSDEWIELYNPTAYTLTLASTTLRSLTDSGPVIPLSGTLSAGAFYLIERTDEDTVSDTIASTTASFGNGLANGGEVLALQIGSTTIDRTPNLNACPGPWCGGDAGGSYPTMERFNPYTAGDDPTNWSSWNPNVTLQNGLNADNAAISGTPGKRNSISYLLDKSSTVILTSRTLTTQLSPYIIYGTTQIPAGITLTIEPGVVVKFAALAALTLEGVIDAEGTEGNEIIFTSLKDDTYAGDTNGNATTTTPAKGDWKGIRINDSGSVFTYTRFRYAGYAPPLDDTYLASLRVEEAEISITHSVFEHSLRSGIRLINTEAEVTNNTFQDNTESGAYIQEGEVTFQNNTSQRNRYGAMLASNGESHEMTIETNTFADNQEDAINVIMARPSFSNNTAEGNGTNGIRFSIHAFQDDAYTLTKDLPYIFQYGASVSEDATLTIEAGTIIKFADDAAFSLFGTLHTEGTQEEPVIFTSLHDDDYGGDTNHNATTTVSAPSDWYSLTFTNTSDNSTLSHTKIRYGGAQSIFIPAGAVRVQDTSITFDHVTIEHNYSIGLFLSNSASTISNSLIRDHTIPASGAYGLFLTNGALPTIASTTFANNLTHIYKDGDADYVDGGGNTGLGEE